ncbi:hypothetical protein ScalyP_jg10441 [Parmales sp. scaly parma]|nr:hypothetical protein ScalyP_jg10441 [Parmales sp. scaly parma]
MMDMLRTCLCAILLVLHLHRSQVFASDSPALEASYSYSYSYSSDETSDSYSYSFENENENESYSYTQVVDDTDAPSPAPSSAPTVAPTEIHYPPTHSYSSAAPVPVPESYSYSTSTDTDGCEVHNECDTDEYCMDTGTCAQCTACCDSPETSFDNQCPDTCECAVPPSPTPVTTAPSVVAPVVPDTGAPSVVVVPDTGAPSVVVVPATDAPSVVVVPATDAPSVSPEAPAPAPVEPETSAPTWDTADTVETVSVTFKGEFALGGMDSDSIPEAGSAAAVELEATIKAALAASLDGIDTSMIKIIGYEMVYERRKLRSLAAGSLKVIFEITVIVPAAHENTYTTSVTAAITEAVTTGALVANVIASSEGTAMATALADITINADSLVVEIEVTTVEDNDDMGNNSGDNQIVGTIIKIFAVLFFLFGTVLLVKNHNNRKMMAKVNVAKWISDTNVFVSTSTGEVDSGPIILNNRAIGNFHTGKRKKESVQEQSLQNKVVPKLNLNLGPDVIRQVTTKHQAVNMTIASNLENLSPRAITQAVRNTTHEVAIKLSGNRLERWGWFGKLFVKALDPNYESPPGLGGNGWGRR